MRPKISFSLNENFEQEQEEKRRKEQIYERFGVLSQKIEDVLDEAEAEGIIISLNSEPSFYKEEYYKNKKKKERTKCYIRLTLISGATAFLTSVLLTWLLKIL